jgi:hypothetical protein
VGTGRSGELIATWQPGIAAVVGAVGVGLGTAGGTLPRGAGERGSGRCVVLSGDTGKWDSS